MKRVLLNKIESIERCVKRIDEIHVISWKKWWALEMWSYMSTRL